MQRAILIRSLILSLLVLSTACGPRLHAAEPQGTESAGSPGLEQVIVVFKTHFDIGYTGLASEVVERYRTSMIDKALDVCDASRDLPRENQFVWTIPGWPMAQILWPDQTPERRERIERAIRDGRLVWHALPGTTHTESLDLEDFVRGMGFSSELSRQFGTPLARDAKMTDVPSHTWIVPTVLRHAGVDFLHIGCNSASGSPDVPRLFWWEGPDGSRLLTMYEASGYGSGLKPPDDWPHKTWLALIHTGDNQGPPPPDQVQKLLAQAERELPGVKVRMGRLSDFADAILAEKPDLPVIRADMPDTWIHGIMSMPSETQIARNIRPDIGTLDALNTLLDAWGVEVTSVKQKLAGAYEGSLMYGEHTWGYSMSPFGYHYGDEWAKLREKGHYARLEQSWAEHGAHVRKAREIVAPALEGNVKALARAVNVDGRRIVVFNPLPWARDQVATVELPGENVRGLKDAATGRPIDAKVTSGVHARSGAGPASSAPAGKPCDRLVFVARNVPPLGYRTYVPTGSSPRTLEGVNADRDTIENKYFRVRVDPQRGVVTSLVDKQSGRELVDASSRYGLGQYLYERFDADNIKSYFDTYLKYIPGWSPHFARGNLPPADKAPYSSASPKSFQPSDSVERRDLGDSLRVLVSATAGVRAQGGEDVPHGIELAVRLYVDQPYVDLDWTVLDKRPDQWPEAGWLCLPFRTDDPTFRLGRLGSVVDPAQDARRGANFDVFCLSTGMTITGPDGKGVGLCPLDSPLVSIGQPGLYRYSKEFGSRDPVVFVNLFNNVWGTNFQQWTEGAWQSRIRIWAVDGTGIEADLITPSWEARSPCKAAFFDGPAGTLPPSQSGIELSRKGVLVTAFGPNPDGDGMLLRLWEQAGEDGPCRVRLPGGMSVSQAQPCDLRGRPQGDPIPVREGQIEVPLRHFAPASLILDTKH
ncbi:MAG TPA: glycoside hydrolase family 38 C-terminal domain-containing protein [Thermoguttaceae bacterium]|nr:glycoside hydrolase family 38 C-terminal domain-containing protein [Thermoguttaceae bacterium]